MPEAFNFLDKLTEARRRARLQGRPLTRQESAGIVSGVAETASQRLDRARRTRLGERELDIRENELKESRKERGKESTMGAVAGGAAIGSIFGPVGMGVGAGVGFVLDKICIIITACYGEDSYQVGIARAYRDKYLDETTLAGYYTLCYWLVPQMVKHPKIKRLVKKWIVDRLVDYGCVKLGYFQNRWYKSTWLITKGFLGFCKILGVLNQIILRSSKNGSSIFTSR